MKNNMHDSEEQRRKSAVKDQMAFGDMKNLTLKFVDIFTIPFICASLWAQIKAQWDTAIQEKLWRIHRAAFKSHVNEWRLSSDEHWYKYGCITYHGIHLPATEQRVKGSPSKLTSRERRTFLHISEPGTGPARTRGFAHWGQASHRVPRSGRGRMDWNLAVL